jgi:hypothetical protein
LNVKSIDHKYGSVTSSKYDSNRNTYREEENEKLNSLIEEYRKENERCAQKISDL